jgi:predicted aspartyl protease
MTGASHVKVVVVAFVLACALGCATPQLKPKHTLLPDAPITIPIALLGGFPAFPADEKDGTSPVFLLDTGAAGVVVTPRFAKRHGVAIRGNSDMEMQDAVGNVRTPRYAHFDRLHVRGATFGRVDAFVDELASLRKGMTDRIDVLLGRSLFEDVLLTIDYPRRRIVLEHGQLPPPDGRDVLPIIRGRSGTILVPINVAGAQTWMVLDTGHTLQGLHLLPERLAGLPWASPPIDGPTVTTMYGSAASQLGRIDREVHIGRHAIHRPIVCTVTSSEREYIGSDVLSHFAITLDQKNDRIRFARTGESPIEIRPLRTLGFSIDDKATVTAVSPATGAAPTGLRVGDRIIAVERQPLAQLRHDTWEVLEDRGTPFQMRVVRDGVTMEVGVGVTTLVE